MFFVCFCARWWGSSATWENDNEWLSGCLGSSPSIKNPKRFETRPSNLNSNLNSISKPARICWATQPRHCKLRLFVEYDAHAKIFYCEIYPYSFVQAYCNTATQKNRKSLCFKYMLNRGQAETECCRHKTERILWNPHISNCWNRQSWTQSICITLLFRLAVDARMQSIITG